MIESSYAKFEIVHIYANLLIRRQEIESASRKLTEDKLSEMREWNIRFNKEKREFFWWYPWKLDLMPEVLSDDDISHWDSYWGHLKRHAEKHAAVSRLIDMCERTKETHVYLCDSHVQLIFTTQEAK